jgi:hypothetical protein
MDQNLVETRSSVLCWGRTFGIFCNTMWRDGNNIATALRVLTFGIYCTYFHPLRTTSPPFPRPLWLLVAPGHPERTEAALDSPKANAARGIPSQPPVYVARAGIYGPP